MKKIALIILAVLMLSSVGSTVAIADRPEVFILEFEEIEKNIFENNLTVQTNIISLQTINWSLDALKKAESNTENDNEKQLVIIEQQIAYYQKQLESLQDVHKPSQAAETGEETLENELPYDPALYEAVNNTLVYIREVYKDNIKSLNQSKQALLSSGSKGNNLESQRLSLLNSIFQLTKSNYQIVREAENLFLSYHSLSFNYKDIVAQLEVKESEHKIIALKKNLGIVSENELKAIETQIKDLNTAINDISEQKNDILVELNYLLGRDDDKELELGLPPVLDKKEIVLNYEADLQEMKEKSYSWLMEINNYVIKNNALGEAEKSYGSSSNQYNEAKSDLQKALLSLLQREQALEKSFNSLYNSVKDKEEALLTEVEKQKDAEKDYSEAKLKYNLGMINLLGKENARLAYEKQNLAVERASHDLSKTYLEYKWMQKGFS